MKIAAALLTAALLCGCAPVVKTIPGDGRFCAEACAPGACIENCFNQSLAACVCEYR